MSLLAVIAMFFTTCDSPMGMGPPIDWEAPVLEVVPKPPNPMYVRQGAILAGTVTDNVAVDRVILRDAATGEELFRATLKGERWEIVMDFTEEQNNEKIAVEVVAYDKAGNTGERSMSAVTLIVDIGPPIIEDIWIQRTEIRRADLEPYDALKTLETTDHLGERKDNVERYQNGLFTIAGNVAETETRIEYLFLQIYDIRDPDNALFEELEKNENSTNFSPRWLISEEALLAAGEAKWPGYSDDYRNGERYYYRVAVIAYDKSENESESLIRVEDEGFFCMWENADIPKGIIDPVVGISSPVVVTKGATLPIEFFDDDQLLWAYTGLLTKDQWEGIKGLNPSDLRIMGNQAAAGSASNTEKLQWLKEQLTGESVVINNWKQDRYPTAPERIKDLVIGKKIDETSMYVQTGGNDQDNGQYILFSLVADRKLAPHPSQAEIDDDPDKYPDTYKTRERMEFWNVDVVDENEPLIVFDTVKTASDSYATSPGNDSIIGAKTGDSPEENTFPKLHSETNLGTRFFEINGYTLRANKASAPVLSHNTVTKFRMAWIPAGRGDDYIPQVQNALKDGSYPGSMNNLENLGIQHWNFTMANDSPATYTKGTLLTGSPQTLDITKPDDIFTKQVFRKKFDVLWGQDDIVTTARNGNAYKNFTYKDDNGVEVKENTTKLFIIYAEDNMGHVVFRQLRLLGNRTPPEMTIFDITDRTVSITEGPPSGLPDLNNPTFDSLYPDYYFFTDGIIDSAGRGRYETKRKAYQETAYTPLKNANPAPNENDIAGTNTAYPRNTFIKYWVTAKSNGDLEVANINMRDITFAGSADVNIGHLDKTNNILTLSYIEKLSEVTQRVFLFEVEDTLGNKARVQRTVAVTNAAVLNNITTTTQSGTYGIGETITLQANFSNLVKWNGTNPPLLNVRFMRNGVETILQIPTKTPVNTDSLSLDFDFVIQQGDTGVLQTMYYNIDNFEDYTNKGTDNAENNRPLKLPSDGGPSTTDTTITDASREDNAFIPRYTASFDWTQDGIGPGKSLQGSTGTPLKTITLDGIRPTVTSFTQTHPTGKPQYTTDGNPGYYYKANDVLTFTLTASKPIFTNGSPIVQFQINNSTWYDSVPWQSSSTPTTMIFSVQVHDKDITPATIPEGTVTGIRLNNVSTIVDSVGNAFAAGNGTFNTNMNISTGNNTIRIDKTPPIAPVTRLNTLIEGASLNTIDTIYYNANPLMQIENNPTSGEDSVVTRHYSLNAGVKWVNYPTPEANWTAAGAAGTGGLNITSGQWVLQTRYIDRAGNEGAIWSRPIHINAKFPDLKSITAVQPDGYYKEGSNLQFDLAFDDVVWTSDTGQVTITLTNRNTFAINNTANNTANSQNKIGRVSPIYERQLTATAVAQTNANNTIRFEWSGITGKEMPDGLYVSAVNFAGLRDRFGNPGGSGAATFGTNSEQLSITIPNVPPAAVYPDNTCANYGAGLKVDCLSPVITTRNPVNAQGVTAGDRTATVSGDNKTITLTFDEAVQKGRGTITVRPHGNYAIPAVFENEGYYLTVSATGEETRYSAKPAGIDSTYVSGMNDVYGNMTTAQRNYLITGGTLSAPDLSNLTGLSVGPYKKMTQGLKQGAGYTGNYNNTNPAAPAAPGRAGAFMVPDTTTKWVLDYQYQIHSTTQTQVNNIRTALTAIGFRRQEIAVTMTNVTITNNNRVVTIVLSEPLLPGLQWDLFYPAGTFTDMAGNSAAAIGDTTYWFWSNGVQTPVIRVDRKSYDARTNVPAPVTGSNAEVPQTYNANGYAGSITDFNTIAYCIETETPGARINYGTQAGTEANGSSITGAWTGRATDENLGANFNTSANLDWNGDKANNETIGQWVRRNLIFRNYNGSANPQNGVYTVTENGIAVTQIVGGANNQRYYGFRSFNRDATPTELSTLQINNINNSEMYAGSFTGYAGLQASKNYVAANAQIDHIRGGTFAAYYTSQRGYEGVFRTVIALNQSAGNNYIVLFGTNVKSGIPNVAGFPVKDGVHNTDTRYLKLFYRNGSQHYWVSTEIVTPWYVQTYRDGNTGDNYLRMGDATDWITAGYGDLSYAFNVVTW